MERPFATSSGGRLAAVCLALCVLVGFAAVPVQAQQPDQDKTRPPLQEEREPATAVEKSKPERTQPAENPRSERLHPLVARLADEAGAETVRVIVRGNSGGGVGAAIDRIGGKGKKALSLVGAYTVEMAAGKLRELATDPEVGWVTLDAAMTPMSVPSYMSSSVDRTAIDTAALAADYPLIVGAPGLWNAPVPITGAGVTVAVVDSGIDPALPDFAGDSGSRVLASVKFNGEDTAEPDQYGHGTHVAGIIAGNGKGSDGKYIGIAPNASLISLKVSDARGMAYTSDVIEALQWAVLNKETYNIKVVNLSLVSSVAESYLTSPLDAAVEMAWLSGITVVVSAGNLGPDSMLYPPANDPLVITVGAVDTSETAAIGDDVLPEWSSYGTTQDSFAKPEVVAPGRKIISGLSSLSSTLARQFPDRVVDSNHLRLSGTSMAAGVISGVAALALEAHPTWTPDQVKSALMASARSSGVSDGAQSVVYAPTIVSTGMPDYANQGIAMNAGVAAAGAPASYDAATWNAATWNSATWSSATWSSATWSSATWSSAAPPD